MQRLLALASLALLLGACAAQDTDRVKRLVAMRDASPDAVITLYNKDWEELAAAKGRDYHLMFFLNARYMATANTNMKLGKLRQEYALAAQAFKRGPDADKVFFVELVYESSKDVFVRLGITQLPFAFHWGPEAIVREGRAIKISKNSQCNERIRTYPWPAEELVQCARGLTGLSAGEVERPSVLKSPLFPLGLLLFILAGGAAAWKVYNSPIVRITGLWAVGALGVYWFATSGGMYNIIRGMPLFYRSPAGKTVWWMEGRSGQLGAEGFVMGSSYIFFSTILASLTYVVPRIRSNSARGGLSLALVLLAAFTAHTIIKTYQNKSGLGMRTFFSFSLW